MAIDFFGVRMAGRIRQFSKGATGPGKVVELWTENQDSELTKDLGALAFVSQIDVKLKMGENASISLVLTPPFEDALKFMQSELIRFGVGRLEVELGYTTGTTTGSGATQQTVLPFSGFLQKPDVSIGSDITITLHALGVGYQMNVVGGVDSQPFARGISYSQAVEETLTKYVTQDGSSSGLVIKDLYSNIPDEVKKTDPFFQPIKQETVTKSNGKPDANVISGIIHKGPRNDWWFVKEVVAENGFDLFIQGNELFIVQKSFWIANAFGQKGDRKHFLLRGVVDPTRNMFPILSFQSPTDAVWLQPGIGKLIARDVDPNKENPDGAEHEASGSETPIARGKESADPVDLAEESEGIQKEIDQAFAAKMMPGNPSTESVRKQIDAHWTDKNMQAGIQGTFTTVGIPSLTPGESIQVSGFEPMGKPWGPGGIDPNKAIFNGVYGVIEVNHNVGVGGWQTSFLGIMNYFPKAFVEAARAVKAKEAEEEKAKVKLQEEQKSRVEVKKKKAKKGKQHLPKEEKLPKGGSEGKTVTSRDGTK